MIEAVRNGFRGLLRFAGRDNRPTFWWWFLAVYIVATLVTMAFTIPFFVSMTASLIEAGRAPDGGAAAEAVMASGMADYMHALVWVSIGSAALMTVLLAAAIVRRLHDAGYSGWLGLVPLAAQGLALARLPSEMDRIVAAMQTGMAGGQVNSMSYSSMSLLGWVPLLLVAVIGLLPTRAGADG